MPDVDAIAVPLEPASMDVLPGRTHALVYEIGGKRLIDDVAITLQSGTISVIMGPNGAGKSILLRLLHGLIAPSAGEVLWGGKRVDDDVRRRQAMVFQRPVLLRRSVEANVEFVLGLRGKTTRQRVDGILSQVGLRSFARQPARLLSGGEQQCLALARALASEPQVLFLDEPTASLDPAATASIESIVRSAHVQGTKVVLVTHDLGQARRMADEVVFLHQGRVTEQTAAGHFFDSPHSVPARDYLDGKLLL